MPKLKRKKKGLPRPENDEKYHAENDPPTAEYQWLNSTKSRDPSDPNCAPAGLRGMSELDAIAWVKKHCKFAKTQGV